MKESSKFDWYNLYRLGCTLINQDKEEYLRTAIDRFYYSAFCESRDFLIENKIFCNNNLKKGILSNSGVVHSATRDIFKYEDSFGNDGKKIANKLYDLRKYRNIADYDSDTEHSFKQMAKQSQAYSKLIFDKLDEL